MAPSARRPANGLGPADLDLLSAIRGHDDALRALLCTLARTGVALRQHSPKRARRWLDELSAHPLFKGGQFLFDLLEWEDFLLDGEPPALLDRNAVRFALERIAGALRSLGSALDGREAQPLTFDPSAAMDAANLPELEPGFYLYQDIVLGVVSMLTSERAGRER